MKKLPHVRNAIYGQPMMITEAGLELVCSVFEMAVEGKSADEQIEARINAAIEERDDEGYAVVNGVAIIPVMGPLFPRANLLTRVSNATSYQEVANKMSEALERNDVATVLFHGDSPGGSVLGCFETCTEIFEARKSTDKPIIGLIEGQGASGCYALLSQCDALFCTEGSMVGAIGVITKMDNYERRERNEGNDITVLRSKELKAPGVGPITPNQMMALQKRMLRYDKMFNDVVKRSRPGMDMEAAASGDQWIGQDAVDMGLCDGVMTLEDAIKTYGDKSLA